MKLPSGWIITPYQTEGGTVDLDTDELIFCHECKYYRGPQWKGAHDMPLFLAHDVCMKWGDGVQTDEFGYCFKAERKEEGEE